MGPLTRWQFKKKKPLTEPRRQDTDFVHTHGRQQCCWWCWWWWCASAESCLLPCSTDKRGTARFYWFGRNSPALARAPITVESSDVADPAGGRGLSARPPPPAHTLPMLRRCTGGDAGKCVWGFVFFLQTMRRSARKLRQRVAATPEKAKRISLTLSVSL